MTPDTDRLRRLNALLQRALELPEAERGPWLRDLPAEHRTLVPTLDRMLSGRAVETGDLMPGPLDVEEFSDLQPPPDAPGDEVGPYRLVAELGHGGMATVWLAERTDGVLQRQVALKLPRPGWALGLAQRMAREREILGTLAHPNIARLYDAGITAAGRPWLAMEQVLGRPIDRHCRETGASVDERLRLFLQVTDAVAHAHARLVVHRDLKPGNILVTPDGEVRLLDFGVAKLLEDVPISGDDLTRTLGRAITPDYAAPEQLAGQPVTVAADVYSLGVVLYELLAGDRPYRLGDGGQRALETALHAVEVPPASRRAGADRALARRLRGDLDNIVAKALHRNPARRYGSVESLAADLRRHLDGEPVHAQPRRLGYRLHKFLRRHRWAVCSAAAVLIALGVGLSLALWQAREAALQREAARALLVRTEAALDFTFGVLTQPTAHGEALTPDELLRRAEAKAEQLAEGSPAEHLHAVSAVAAWYGAMGADARADQLLTRTLESLSPSADAATVRGLRCLRAQRRASLGQAAEALADTRVVLDQAPDDDPAARVACLHARAYAYSAMNNASAMLVDLQEALRLFEDSGRRSAETRARLLAALGHALSYSGRPGEAHAQFALAATLLAGIGREEGPTAIEFLNDWAIALLVAGQPALALERLERAGEVSRRRMPAQALQSSIHSNRGTALRALGRFDEALAAYDQGLDAARRESNPAIEANLHANRAVALAQAGRMEAAAQDAGHAEALIRQGGLHPGTSAAFNLAWARALMLHDSGRSRAADETLSRLHALQHRQGVRFGPQVPQLALRSAIALSHGQLDDAERLAGQALELGVALQGPLPQSVFTAEAWLARARVQRARGQAAEARNSCEQALKHLQAGRANAHPAAERARRLAAELG